MADDITKKGTLQCVLTHSNDWIHDSENYRFTRVESGKAAIQPIKYGDGTLEVHLENILGVTDIIKIPDVSSFAQTDNREMIVSITWGEGEIGIWLNGTEAHSQRV